MALPVASAPAAETLAPGFRDVAVLGSTSHPSPQVTTVRFAPNGEVFAAGQDGRVWEYPNVEARRPHLVADVSGDRAGTDEIMNWQDRGLLGLAVDPAYPVRPYLYLLYTYNAPPGRKAPVWPWDERSRGNTCPNPPGPATPNWPPAASMTNGDGCVASGRLSRITLDPRTHRMVPGSEVSLIKNDWCDQSFSHSIGDLQFAPDGSLYVSGGAGGIFSIPDYGEIGGSPGDPITPRNPCGDPSATSGPGPGHPGRTVEPSPSNSPKGISGAEGGMLRAQSVRRPLDQPATLDGTVARIDPATGDPLPNNPNASASDLDRRRIVAYGLRQPFRFVLRPGTRKADLWVGDVGEERFEEVDEDPAPLRGPSVNFGWPCFEGNALGPTKWSISYYSNFEQCAPTVRRSRLRFPFYSYSHSKTLFAGNRCPIVDGSSVTAIAFADRQAPYPRRYRGALFLGDFTRDCIWALLPDKPGGRPDTRRPVPIAHGGGVSSAAPVSPVDFEVGPDRALYYVNRITLAIRRLSYGSYPIAVASADRTLGRAPLTVHFRGGAVGGLTAAARHVWRFGDSGPNDSRHLNPSHTYTSPGLYEATLTLRDRDGKQDQSSIRIAVGPVFSGVKAIGSTVSFTLLESAVVRVRIGSRSASFSVPAGHHRLSVRGLVPPGSYRATVRPFYGAAPIAAARTVRVRF